MGEGDGDGDGVGSGGRESRCFASSCLKLCIFVLQVIMGVCVGG